MKNFTTLVERFSGVGTWTYATIPFDCEKEFGSKSRIRVKGQINQQDIEATLMPHGNGKHFIILTKEIRDKTKITIGDTIKINLELDSSNKTIEAPKDLLVALKKEKRALDYYDKLAPSHKGEYAKWITEAKKEETRQNRILKAVEKLKNGQRLK